jgi:DivIVA domain-containing protein
MGTALVYLVVMVAVGGVLFLAASFVFGRGEQMAPLPAGYTAAVLPENQVTGADVRALKFQQVVRGYKASEVDWARGGCPHTGCPRSGRGRPGRPSSPGRLPVSVSRV